MKKCYVCGHKAIYNYLGSTNEFGWPDLDMRLPEMHRSTMDTWVQCCEMCGYCGPDISTGSSVIKIVVNTTKYHKQKNNYVIPKLAKNFLCWHILAKYAGNLSEAGWAALYAAWVCDDHNEVTKARHCREKAIGLFRTARKKGLSFADDADTEIAVIIDMLRRCGQFQGAKTMCEKALKRESASNVQKIMLFQINLIKRKDINTHYFDESCDG